MKQAPLLLLFSAATALFSAEIQPKDYLDHIKYLSSPELKGRATGTPELEKAGQYLVKEFKSFHLRPVNGEWRQPFAVTVGAELEPGNVLRFVNHGTAQALEMEKDFLPMSFSSTGKLSAKLVFAGYGITAPEYNYDDYAGLDVKGKIVIVLRHEPQEFDEKSVFLGKNFTRHAQIESKATNAKMHGAAGVLFVEDVHNHGGAAEKFEAFGKLAGPDRAGVAFVQVRAELIDQWIRAAGKNVKDLQEGIDKDLKPRSFPLPDDMSVDLDVEIRRDTKTVHNIIAWLPGETDEYVIVGAHYDHLGFETRFSLAPSSRDMHPGADDNASGTAGVLELARYFASQPKQKRGILFLCFAGEELGLLGSSWYAGHPLLPLDKAVAMINMDMIGRIRDGKLYLAGSGTGSNFKAMIDDAVKRHPLKADLSETAGYGSSDHTSFTSKQVPVLFFFSGLHGDYHKPSDTWDKIDAPQAVEVLKLVADLAHTLATEDGRPQYVRVEPPRMNPHGGDPSATGGGGGYGPYFGSIPDFAEVPKGVKFADVTAGSPAAKAGLKGGDILIEFDGKPVDNLYDFTYALRSKKPGDQVLVKVLRGADTIEANVLLTVRR